MWEKSPTSIWDGRMRVELNKKSLFALASDTRLEILKSLEPMRRTVSQLAEVLEIDKAAVHRHLKKLEEGELVKRFEDHGFVYYGLSWKARDLLSPGENTRIVILLSCSWLLIFGVMFLVLLGTLGDAGYRDDLGFGLPSEDESRPLADAGSSIFLGIAATLLASCALVLILVAFRMIRRPKQRSSATRNAHL